MQTPRTYVAIMNAVRTRERTDAEASFVIAHATAAFVRAKKLDRIEAYLPKAKVERQTPREMVAVLEALRSRGANITIERVGG